MSYPRFAVKCFLTFLVFPLVFTTPCLLLLSPSLSGDITRAIGQSIDPNFSLRTVPELARYWPVFVLFLLAFLVWSTLTYVLWFKVANRTKK